uniref:MYND-type domain-containing protein n=1 Tax=Panagrolaimus sp. ES5 TaxID=591445 RepID=A0AC34GN69_9BILA
MSDFFLQNHYDSKSKSDSRSVDKYEKTLNSFSSDRLNVLESQEKKQKKPEGNSSVTKSSTLSLHIAAYEKDVESSAAFDADNHIVSNESLTKNSNCNKTWKGVKQLFTSSSQMDFFEIPRQQNQKKVSNKPEVMQFKASQKLHNPNEQKSKVEMQKEKDKKKMEKLKEETEKVFKAGEYRKAVNLNNDMLIRFCNIMNKPQKAELFSNRSAAYLMLKDEDSIELAKNDANLTIKNWPSWWKGYFCLGRVQAELKEWNEAEKSFEKALAKNPKSKETQDELNAVKVQITNIHRYDKIDSPDFLSEKFQNFIFEDMFEKRDPMNYDEFGKCIEEAAKKGSFTAQRHMKMWKNLDDAIIAFEKDDFAEVVAALSRAIHLDHQIFKIPDFMKPFIEDRIRSHRNDLDTAVHPNSLRLLYCYAVALCQQEGQPPECIKALDKFLAVAPKDNDKVPACHYRKAMFYNYHKDIPNFLASFEAGLAAEKEQLPCFLPYFFKAKTLMEKLYMIEKQKATNLGTSSSKKSAAEHSNPRLEQFKLDLPRKILLRKNRETFTFVIKQIEEKYIDLESVLPLQIPNLPYTKNLKKIMLKDMDPTKDKIYDGFILEGKILDWAIVMTGITNIFEDENGDVQRLAVYNWPLKKSAIKTAGINKFNVSKAIKDFYPNSKVSIINPYMRLIKNGSIVIQVESPAFIKIDKTSTDNKCHCCGKEGKILPCSGCMMAKYCSKECQKHDWIEFNHKEICKHLKMFSKMK